MRAFLGLLPAAQGRMEILGTDARALHRCQAPVAVALDPPGLDDTLTVRQNLELARIRAGIRDGRSVDEALELVGLSHRAHHRGDRLSHGQGRRAAVARALLGRPELLVLDEPLSGLDPEGVEVLIGLFRQLAFEEGVTVVLSSHHLREVEAVCTRVGMIEGGRTVLEGRVDVLLQSAGDGLHLRCQDGVQAAKILGAQPQIRDVVQQPDGRLSLVRARLVEDLDLADLLRHLVEAGCGVEEFVRDRASLVDVFQQAVSAPSEAVA